MNVIIFGATGGTGRNAVQRALASGHHVTAFARRPEAIETRHERLSVAQGDVLDPTKVAAALKGQEAVLSALGPPAGTHPGTLISDGLRNIVAAMKSVGARKLVFESGLMIGGRGLSAVGRLMIRAFRAMNHSLYEDKVRAEAIICDSGLDWVMVRPPMLAHKEARGTYRAGVDLAASLTKAMAHADVADFMVKALTEAQWNGKAVELSY